MNGAVWAVIKREYLQRVRSRWFLIATIAGPLLLIGLIAAPILLANRGEERERTLTIVDGTGVLYDRVAPRLAEAGYTVQPSPGDAAELERLTESVREGSLGGFLELDEGTLTRGEFVMHAHEAPSPVRTLTIRQAVVQTALEARLGGSTEDVRALLSGGNIEVDVLSVGPGGLEDATFVAAYLGAFLLYMSVLFYAVAVMRSVLEEKTSRIVEVVLSSMRPYELMLGKILGVGAVGLTQFAIWIVSATVIFSVGAPALLAARPDFISPETLAGALPGLGYAFLFAAYFVGGYFIYSGLYAAVGATCNTDEEAQQAQMPVVMLLVVPIIFVTQVIQDPQATLSVALSFVPFFTPILMFARAAVGGASALEVALSMVLMAATVMAVAWVAGRIYKVGILMAGKRPTLPEILRWVREA
jgi:ABC-2 type transport system permease protein